MFDAPASGGRRRPRPAHAPSWPGPGCPPATCRAPPSTPCSMPGTRGPLTIVSAGRRLGQDARHGGLGGRVPRGRSGGLGVARLHRQPAARLLVLRRRGAAAWDAVAPDNPLAQLRPGPRQRRRDPAPVRARGSSGSPSPWCSCSTTCTSSTTPRCSPASPACCGCRCPSCGSCSSPEPTRPCPLHRLRVGGRLGEIRSADLALDATDAAALVAEDGVVLGPEDAALLVQRTEGWPAGLRLAALFLARDEPGHGAADFGGDDHAVVEYLAEEVLARYDRPTCGSSCVRTSVAERVNASLAEELTGQTRGRQHLEELAASNTFVVALGPTREWYRYHALLRQMLRHRLSVEAPGRRPRPAPAGGALVQRARAAPRGAAPRGGRRGLAPDGAPAREPGAPPRPVGRAGGARSAARPGAGPPPRRHPRAGAAGRDPRAAREPVHRAATPPHPGHAAAGRDTARRRHGGAHRRAGVPRGPVPGAR